MRTVGEALRASRRARGWTQPQLADASGLPQPEISRAERDQVVLGSLELARIERALELEPGHLQRLARGDHPAGAVDPARALAALQEAVEAAQDAARALGGTLTLRSRPSTAPGGRNTNMQGTPAERCQATRQFPTRLRLCDMIAGHEGPHRDRHGPWRDLVEPGAGP